MEALPAEMSEMIVRRKIVFLLSIVFLLARSAVVAEAGSTVCFGRVPRIVTELIRGGASKFRIPTPTRYSAKPSGYDRMAPRSYGRGPIDRSELDEVLRKAASQPNKKITLTANKQEARPGDLVTFTAVAPKGAFDLLLSDQRFDGAVTGALMMKFGSKFVATIRIPEDFSGILDYSVWGGSDDGSMYSNTVRIVVKPDMADIVKLEFQIPADRIILTRGISIEPTLFGISKNGVKYDVSYPEMGTTYSSSASDIVGVSAEGAVEAIRIGESDISARNGNLETRIRVKVISFDVVPMGGSTPLPPSEDPQPVPQPPMVPQKSRSGCNSGEGLFVWIVPAIAFLLRKSFLGRRR